MSQLPIAHIEFRGDVPAIYHNMPCPICYHKHAVYQTNNGIFLPCWRCQEKGFKLIKTKSKFILKILHWLGVIKLPQKGSV